MTPETERPQRGGMGEHGYTDRALVRSDTSRNVPAWPPASAGSPACPGQRQLSLSRGRRPCAGQARGSRAAAVTVST